MDRATLILTLLNLPRVGRKTALKLLANIARESTANDRDAHAAVGDAGLVVDANVFLAMAENAREALEVARQAGVTILAAGEMPEQLESIPDPPALLFVKGNVGCLSEPDPIAIVGTREPTEYGYRCAKRFGQRCAESGIVVVSGLAKGCDAAAHEGCVDANGKTIAVLAHGLDKIYPKENSALAERILEKGGCWVSEYPLGARAQRSYFVERDRLQAGLSAAVIVIETSIDGGTMHTVGFAERQRRLIACLALAEKGIAIAEGNQMLIESGRGRALRGADDFSRLLIDARNRAVHGTA